MYVAIMQTIRTVYHLTGYVIFECEGMKQEARPMLSQRSRATLSNYLIISDFNTLGRTFSSSIWYKVYTVNSFIHEIYNKTLSIVKKKLSCRTETARRFICHWIFG